MPPRKKEGFQADSGFFYYVDAWLGSEIRLCSPGATGLWSNMLATMWKQCPRGVLPGDREGLAEAMAVGGMVDAWWEIWGVHIPELERRGVFSRGEDIDPELPPDAIVNRRMYREWCKGLGRTAQATKAATIRWERERGYQDAETIAILEKIDAEVTSVRHAKTCSFDAEGEKLRDAHAMLNEETQTVDIKAVTTDSRCSMDAQKNESAMLSECHSKPKETKSKPKSSEPERVGNVIPMLKPDLSGKGCYGRICSLTQVVARHDPWAVWWKVVVKEFERRGLLIELDSLVCRAESGTDIEGNPIGHKRKWLVANVLRRVREHKFKVRNHPAAKESA